MSAIDELFARLKADGGRAFMPFITAGDPDLDFTVACLKALDKAGCHLVELGIPYSDPIADGPVIQASYTRALNQGTKLDAIFEQVKSLRPEIKMPIVAMISYAIIYRLGVDAFLDRAIAAGMSGAIVPDMPVDESGELAKKCAAQDFSLIQLVTPTTPENRVQQIVDRATGFIYYVSITGTTGERTELPIDLVSNIEAVKAKTELPVCVGFGISQPSHAEMLKSVADGMIVGSAIVRRIARIESGSSREEVITEIGDFAKEMLNAINS